LQGSSKGRRGGVLLKGEIEMGDKLKPCPFCGGEASRSTGKTNDGKDWPYIECEDCGAMAEPEDWNRRVIDQQWRKFMTHDSDCHKISRIGVDNDCTCGLDRALKES